MAGTAEAAGVGVEVALEAPRRGRVPGHDQDGVVARDRAHHAVDAGEVDGPRHGVRVPGWRPHQRQVLGQADVVDEQPQVPWVDARAEPGRERRGALARGRRDARPQVHSWPRGRRGPSCRA